MSRTSGFTLLELCLAIAIGVIILTIALPSLGWIFAEQKLRANFEKFDALATKAQELSMSRRKPYLLVWDDTGVSLRPEEITSKDEPAVSHLDAGKNEAYDLQLPSALVEKPPKQWVFWPTGTCEPANIIYHGSAGNWIARYNPLTARGKLSLNETL